MSEQQVPCGLDDPVTLVHLLGDLAAHTNIQVALLLPKVKGHFLVPLGVLGNSSGPNQAAISHFQ